MGFNLGDIVGGGLGSLVKDVVGAFKMDPTKKAELEAAISENEWQFKFKEMELNAKIEEAVTAQVTAQIEVNKLEAQGNWYQSSWRPTVGYICCLGLLFEFFVRPVMAWGSSIWGWPSPPPLDMRDLMTILGGILGLGTLRTIDKKGEPK